MTYPPQSGGFNPQGGGYPQGQQPHGVYGQPGQQPGGYNPQQGYGQPGPQHGGYTQQQGGFTQQQGGYNQQQFTQPPRSSLWQWIAVAVLGVVVIGVLVWLFAPGIFGGGQYAGKEVPALPSSFGGWSKTEPSEDDLGISFGDTYEKGGDSVTAMRVEADPDDKPDPTAVPSDFEGMDVPEPRKIGAGMTCTDVEYSGITSTSCFAVYENGVVMFSSETPGPAEAALKDFVAATK